MKQKKVCAVLAMFGFSSYLVISAGADLPSSESALFNTTPGFGKTHFIVGYPQEDYKTLLSAPVKTAVQESSDIHVFFSPDDNLQEEFNALVRQENTSIKVAVYVFTNKDIADELIAAKKRGVNVQVVTDPGHMKDRHSKIGSLLRAGIPIFEYNPDYIKDGRSNIMHHKFAIFGNPDSARAVVWTGSFNFTKSATTRNQENAVVVRGGTASKRFADQFELVKKRCVRCYNSSAHPEGSVAHLKDKNTTFAKNHNGVKHKRFYV